MTTPTEPTQEQIDAFNAYFTRYELEGPVATALFRAAVRACLPPAIPEAGQRASGDLVDKALAWDMIHARMKSLKLYERFQPNADRSRADVVLEVLDSIASTPTPPATPNVAEGWATIGEAVDVALKEYFDRDGDGIPLNRAMVKLRTARQSPPPPAPPTQASEGREYAAPSDELTRLRHAPAKADGGRPKCPRCGKNDTVTEGGRAAGEFFCWGGCGIYFTTPAPSPPVGKVVIDLEVAERVRDIALRSCVWMAHDSALADRLSAAIAEAEKGAGK